MEDATTQFTTELSYVTQMQTWNSGGDVMLDIIELEGGLTLVVGEETVSVYPTVDDFWAECDDGGRAQSPHCFVNPGRISRFRRADRLGRWG